MEELLQRPKELDLFHFVQTLGDLDRLKVLDNMKPKPALDWREWLSTFADEVLECRKNLDVMEANRFQAAGQALTLARVLVNLAVDAAAVLPNR